MTTIVVSGTGEKRIPAERAILTAEIRVADLDRAESMAAGARLHNQIVARAEALRAAVDATWHQAVAPMTSLRWWTDQDGTEHRDHVTTSSVTIRLSTLSLVSDLVAELSALGAAVHTDWALTETTRRDVTCAMYALAVADAGAKASDLAAALGKNVAVVAAIREQPTHGGFVARSMAARSPEDASAIVTIPELTVSASIEAEYQTD